MLRSKQSNKAVSLPVIEPNAAGIDVGATEIFVAVRPRADPVLPHIHSRFGKTGGLASTVPYPSRGHGVDRGVLDSAVPDSGEAQDRRSLWRHRENLIQLVTLHLQHMQKALDQMNLQIHHVISDLDGTTGLAIMDAILAGERDPHKLAQLRHPRVRASEETIMKSLVGDYRQEHLFTLRQSLQAYRYYQR